METLEERRKRLEEEKAKADAVFKSSKAGFVRGSAYGLGLSLAATLLANRYCT